MQQQRKTPASAVMHRTSVPAIYKRGARYVVIVRGPDGKQIKRSAATMAEAKAVQGELRAAVHKGEYRRETRLTVAEYFADWLPSYQGRTSRGVRPQTLDGYRAQMENHVLPALARKRLAELEPRDI